MLLYRKFSLKKKQNAYYDMEFTMFLLKIPINAMVASPNLRGLLKKTLKPFYSGDQLQHNTPIHPKIDLISTRLASRQAKRTFSIQMEFPTVMLMLTTQTSGRKFQAL